MAHLAPGEIFENMLQLKRFRLYFEGILNRKWLFSNSNSDISCRDAKLEVRGHAPRENFEMIDAIWCVLMYYLIRLCLKKVPLFILKIIIIATHLATLLLSVTLPENKNKTCSS